jgi:CheY-like chemotaxis protein
MILVVDDQADTCRLMEKLLQDEGYDVATATSGAEALEQVRCSKPALILLDIRMPGLSGIEVAHHLRVDPSNDAVRVLFFTAERYPATDDDARSLGADGIVHKPIGDLDLFFNQVREQHPV